MWTGQLAAFYCLVVVDTYQVAVKVLCSNCGPQAGRLSETVVSVLRLAGRRSETLVSVVRQAGRRSETRASGNVARCELDCMLFFDAVHI